jgi:hypothetical protein
LDKSEFERALKLGLGRALLYVKEHPDAPYRDLILDVCLHTTVYDGQIEGSREVYLYEVLQSTNDYSWYRQRILAAFSGSPALEGSDYSHLFALVLYMAQHGDQEARDRIYARVREDAADAWDYVGDMLSLDGLRGLQFVVRLQPIQSDDWEFDRIAATLIEDFPEQANEETLRALLPEHPDFLTPLLVVLRDRSDPTWDKRNRARLQAIREQDKAEFSFGYDKLKEYLATTDDKSGRVRRTMQYWARYASEDDLAKAAHDLEVEQHEPRLLAYLSIFHKRRFPLEPDRLIAIATQHRVNIDERVDSNWPPTLSADLAMRAFNALALVPHPDVRTLALSIIGQAPLMFRAVKMLVENFQPGDWVLLASLAQRHDISHEDYHGLGMGIRSIFEAHPHTDAVPALLNLYEYNPCSHCRHTVVENLHSLNAFPDWMIRECAHDSYSDTREFIMNEAQKK